MKTAADNSITGKKTHDRKKTARMTTRGSFPLVATIIAVILLLIIATVILVNTINSSVYSERKQYLSEITKASAETVNESIENHKDEALVVKNMIEKQLPQAKDARKYIATIGDQLSIEGDIYFLVDSDGRYYSSDDHEGRIVDRTYYTENTEDQLEYLSTLPHLSSDKTYLIYRFRLDKPITTTYNGRTVEIRYFAMMHDLDKLNNTVSSLFEGTNNTFIYETDTGTMLYKQFGLGTLVNGYVIYPKFSDVELVNEEDPNELIEQCKNGKTVVVEMNIDETRFYFCSAPLDTGNWSLAFVVQSEFLSSASGSSFSSVIYAIIIFAILLSIATIAVVGMALRMRSDRKEQAALAIASEAKSKFLFNMSHDIRTPMNAIIGFTDIAIKNVDNRDKVIDSLKKTQISGNLLLSLINDILEFSRIENGKVTLNETSTDIVSMFDKTNAILSDMATGKDIELTFEQGTIKNRYVLLDEIRCQRLLINIISNGIKYTPDGGWVKVRMEQMNTEEESEEGVYSFIIEDNGIGMSEEFQSHLFEEFSREENSTTSGIQGTGLGLALCKAITDMMGGTIDCTSKQGEGSRFTIILPLKILAGEYVEAIARTVEVNQASLQGCRALLVEDNELNREIAVDMLEEEGISVEEAENGKIALDILKEEGIDAFDFILTDIQMPIMDGYEFVREIGILYPERNVPVIALSANAFEEDKEKSRQAGMTDHIAKPIAISELRRVLARHKREGDTK